VKNGVVTLTGEVHSQTTRAGKRSLPGCRTVSKS
jgi:osmotically-inducible protein OsmY